MNILDFILIAIFIACVINSYYKGFFKQVFDILGFIIGIAFFAILYPIINNWLLKSTFLSKVKDWVISDLNLAQFVATTQEDIVSGIQNLNAPEIIKELLIKNNNNAFYELFGVDNVVEYIANFVAMIVISLVTVFFVVLVVDIIITILNKTNNIASRLPVLGKLDKIGGIVLGIINGLFTLWLLGIIILVLSVFPQLSFLKDQLDGFLTGPLINDNILSKLLLNLILGIIN
ncbi:CvpA family protein [uncultured Tyzzerella sp.]|uniref:CvpA family protein n=1 Tax=uncultured Tyzzerella sp. TaxID=2321398 RepID=UPI0029427F36|nr:CvpA family protein [uncultured Tyzzerella sp.]